MKNVWLIIFKYAFLIFLIRNIFGLFMGFFKRDLITGLILILLISFPVWFFTNKGTEELSSFVKGRRKLEYTGYLIPILAVVPDFFFSYFSHSNIVDNIVSLLLVFTIGGFGASRAAKEKYNNI